MSFFNIDIDKVLIVLKDRAEDDYINQYNNPQKDDDGTYISPSLERAIETVLDTYFSKNYKEVPEKFENEHEEIYNKLQERLLNELDEDKIHALISDMKENYKGLSDYERNSGKY